MTDRHSSVLVSFVGLAAMTGCGRGQPGDALELDRADQQAVVASFVSKDHRLEMRAEVRQGVIHSTISRNGAPLTTLSMPLHVPEADRSKATLGLISAIQLEAERVAARTPAQHLASIEEAVAAATNSLIQATASLGVTRLRYAVPIHSLILRDALPRSRSLSSQLAAGAAARLVCEAGVPDVHCEMKRPPPGTLQGPCGKSKDEQCMGACGGGCSNCVCVEDDCVCWCEDICEWHDEACTCCGFWWCGPGCERSSDCPNGS